MPIERLLTDQMPLRYSAAKQSGEKKDMAASAGTRPEIVNPHKNLKLSCNELQRRRKGKGRIKKYLREEGMVR